MKKITKKEFETFVNEWYETNSQSRLGAFLLTKIGFNLNADFANPIYWETDISLAKQIFYNLHVEEDSEINLRHQRDFDDDFGFEGSFSWNTKA